MKWFKNKGDNIPSYKILPVLSGIRDLRYKWSDIRYPEVISISERVPSDMKTRD